MLQKSCQIDNQYSSQELQVIEELQLGDMENFLLQVSPNLKSHKLLWHEVLSVQCTQVNKPDHQNS